MIFGKDSVLKDVAVLHESRYGQAFNLKVRIEKEIDDYKSLGNISDSSTVLSALIEAKSSVEAILKKINSIELDVYDKVTTVRQESDLLAIRREMEGAYSDIENCLKQISEQSGS